MVQLLELFHSKHDNDLLGFDLQIIQALLGVDLSSKFYTVYTVLFHKYAYTNVGVTNIMLHLSMLVPTNANVKMANGNKGYAQVIGIILYHFLNFPIINPVRPVYNFQGQPSNTISLGALKCYAGFQKVTSETLEHYDFFDPQGHS